MKQPCRSILQVFFTFELPLQAENNVNLAENVKKTKQESCKYCRERAHECELLLAH